MCEQYRPNIEAILKDSDLSTITTKKVRRTLEEQTGTSLEPMKKEINAFIEEIFVNFQPPEKPVDKSSLVVDTRKKSLRKTTPATIKKKEVKKKAGSGEKKAIDWPLLKINSPLSTIIDTDLCSRPQTVKRLWEYIRKNKLQSENDKRVINCDDLLKEICKGKETINAFTINKYLKDYFVTIPKEEQETYKQILREREGKQSQDAPAA
ncbi:SWIB/MDM2 domain-containing protein [Gilbertella persicaria]|uniref:SWIB/MDM2 domain-containing protein n=1 Tax=Gilbertella persicaria TaxID=101096 RepID=UPI0022210A50|nr:SWIB/MDM2 domain-containing protein [Gilbertella persicaria]KAI8092429.1 SWIB/MDM2 domain-containing protein [Gilbertella persicaria]